MAAKHAPDFGPRPRKLATSQPARSVKDSRVARANGYDRAAILAEIAMIDEALAVAPPYGDVLAPSRA